MMGVSLPCVPSDGVKMEDLNNELASACSDENITVRSVDSDGKVGEMTLRSLSFRDLDEENMLRPDVEDLNNELASACSDENVTVRSVSSDGKVGEMILRSLSFKDLDTENMLRPDVEDLNNELASACSDENVTVRSVSSDFKVGEMTLRSLSFKDLDAENMLRPTVTGELVIEEPVASKRWEPKSLKIDTTFSFQMQNSRVGGGDSFSFGPIVDGNSMPPLKVSDSFKKLCRENSVCSPYDKDAAAVKLQKFYKSYRTRRNLADCAVVVEELWWKALDFAALKLSSVSFYNIQKSETAHSRWSRARTRAAKVGKGLSEDEKAQKLALQHWLEAIDPRHRYGHNLHFYYDVWFEKGSNQPFFYWLDVGEGKEVNLEKCPRGVLQRQSIKYLGPKEREAYEVIVTDGKLVYKQTLNFVDTMKDNERSKWIFVLSTSKKLYVGQKKKGVFQHSSFLAGGAISSAGRLVVHCGVLKTIWPYSGHYHPTEENFDVFISFLRVNNIDLTDVERCSIDADNSQTNFSGEFETETEATMANKASKTKEEEGGIQLGNRLSCKWTTGAGPRIGCVRVYSPELQLKALEQVNLSPRVTPPFGTAEPIPSPRPSPGVRLSPRLSGMSITNPSVPF